MKLKKGDMVVFVKASEYDSTPEEQRSTFIEIPIGAIATVQDVGEDGWPELILGNEFDNDVTYMEPDVLEIKTRTKQ